MQFLSGFGQSSGTENKDFDRPLIFLDFNGHTVLGSSWNWNGPIEAEGFGATESVVNEIRDRVQEDFCIFDLQVTLDSTAFEATHPYRRVRVIITPTNEWYGAAGGVAYTGSFNWGDDTPVWVFSSQLQNNPKYIAEAISHEVGHAFGLHHQSRYRDDCSLLDAYLKGRGSGQTGWAPIMGIGYYHNLTTWHTGPSALGCKEIQDDISAMQQISYLSLIADDHSDDTINATVLYPETIEFGASGILNNGNDKDYFVFSLIKTTRIRLTAIPFYAGPYNEGANVHLRLRLYHPGKKTFEYATESVLNTAIDTVLSKGKYFVAVEGRDNHNMQKRNGMGRYVLTGVSAHALALSNLELRGAVQDGHYSLSWNFQTDEAIRSIIIQSSNNGLDFSPLVSLESQLRSWSGKFAQEPAVYYRIKITGAAEGKNYYSNIILLKQEKKVHIMIHPQDQSNQIPITVSLPSVYQFFDTKGVLIRSGNLPTGFSMVGKPSGHRSVLILKVQNQRQQVVRRLIP